MHAETELVYPKFEIARVNAQKGAEGCGPVCVAA